ncbi:MAG: hypothetical protein HQK50_03640 [Oligoflexia bacterium]|nr:hypothetical protein [Oligoflexia bacterium]
MKTKFLSLAFQLSPLLLFSSLTFAEVTVYKTLDEAYEVLRPTQYGKIYSRVAGRKAWIKREATY